MARASRQRSPASGGSPTRGRFFPLLMIALFSAVAAAAGAALLINIFERKQEARHLFYRVVELTDEAIDPAIWGKNFPLQYDAYPRTVDQVRTRFGGSDAVPRTPDQADPRSIVAQSRLEEDPRLKMMWAGYAFARAFREDRGPMPTCSMIKPLPNAKALFSNPGPACTATPRCMWPISNWAREI